MKLVRRLIELAVVVFVISLFMKNKDAVMQVDYYGFSAPISVAFWELVTFCVSLGIIVAAVGDFITRLKWASERRHIVKRDNEHQQVVGQLNQRIADLEAENRILKADQERAPKSLPALGQKADSPATARVPEMEHSQEPLLTSDKSGADPR